MLPSSQKVAVRSAKVNFDFDKLKETGFTTEEIDWLKLHSETHPSEVVEYIANRYLFTIGKINSKLKSLREKEAESNENKKILESKDRQIEELSKKISNIQKQKKESVSKNSFFSNEKVKALILAYLGIVGVLFIQTLAFFSINRPETLIAIIAGGAAAIFGIVFVSGKYIESQGHVEKIDAQKRKVA
jgi:predicted RNase H-like nuclease (RuvC/YqgF family)